MFIKDVVKMPPSAAKDIGEKYIHTSAQSGSSPFKFNEAISVAWKGFA